MDDHTDDKSVIAEILAGNVNKYALLIQKYNLRLYRVCKSYLTDEAEIEDTMQDAYIRAYEKLSTFEHRSQFATWLTRILINEALQKLRNKKKFPLAGPETQKKETMKITDGRDPESRSVDQEFRKLIESNIEALPDSYRVVFIMREVEKMNVADTANALLISESNVKVRLNRAKEMLRESLLKAYPLDELYEFNLVRCARIAEQVMNRITSRKAIVT